MSDDDRYNPDGYGCRKPTLLILGVLVAVVVFICL